LRALRINPLVDWRARDEKPIPEDVVSIPEYKGFEKETTELLGWLGVSGYAYERYELSFSALDLYWNRRYASAPEDSIPAWVFFYHGLAAAHLNSWEKAAGDFTVLLKRAQAVERSDSLINFPLNTNDFRYILAIFKEHLHKPAEAVQLYQDAINADLGLYMAHVRLAQLYRQYKMWDKAVAEAQAAVDVNPDDASLLVDLAAIDREAGRLPDAQAALTKAAAVDGRYPEVFYRLGIVSQELNQSGAARDAFTRFIAVAPHRLADDVTDARKRLATVQ
jgi:tetratricopeptide (TPR) repeat protein